jgi:hypothetical protein
MLPLSSDVRAQMTVLGWSDFVSACGPRFDDCANREELVLACAGDTEIACAVYFHAGEHSLAWLASPVPALQGRSPLETLAAGRGDELRKVLLRMP